MMNFCLLPGDPPSIYPQFINLATIIRVIDMGSGYLVYFVDGSTLTLAGVQQDTLAKILIQESA